MDISKRHFFGGKGEEKDPSQKDEEKAAEGKENGDEKPEEKKEESKSSSSSSETSASDEDALDLTKEDIDKIKKLISDQDATIEKHEKEIGKLEKELKKYKQELIYQRAENDNTVKRYRQQMEDSKSFAISKFAKELLDVRDNLALALEHIDVEKLSNTEDIDMLKVQMQNIVKGQEMTTVVMDKVLGKFDVKQFDPIGEKFDPNIHDAVFMMPGHEEYENNHVGQVIQSGWKIGKRVLRAAKCGIVKK